MGTVIHEATLVTSWNAKMLDEAHLEALRIFPAEMVTSIGVSPVNKYGTFVILPCGSKDGWPDKERDKYDRAEFMRWVATKEYEDGSNCLEIGAVRYGNDLPAASPTTPGTGECE